MDQNVNLDKVEKIIEDSPISNPDNTFCENTTYLELLLSNAKDDEEIEQIKETINGYLDIYDSGNVSVESNDDKKEDE